MSQQYESLQHQPLTARDHDDDDDLDGLDDHNALETTTRTTTEKPYSAATGQRPTHRYFKTPDALHSAISFAAGTTMLLFGYEQGVFGGIIVADEFQEFFNHPTPGVEGFVVSVYDLGCFAGALLTLLVGEKLGRKRMLIVFTIIMGIGIVMQTAAQNMDQMIWGRFVAGIGNGGNTATAPVGIAKLLPRQRTFKAND